MWFIFISYFCLGGVCNTGSSIGPGYQSQAKCETARKDLSTGRAKFFTMDGKPGIMPLSVTSCRQR
jgi:hypothetical protein